MGKIRVEATIAAPVAEVWEYWTSPEHITKWNFATDEWHCPRAANDLKVGGTYSARMEAKDGSFGFDFVAIYNEIINHKRITYTMLDGRQATTDFEEHREKTKVTTIFDAEEKNPEELQRGGWQTILNNFKAYVESRKAAR